MNVVDDFLATYRPPSPPVSEEEEADRALEVVEQIRDCVEQIRAQVAELDLTAPPVDLSALDRLTEAVAAFDVPAPVVSLDAVNARLDAVTQAVADVKRGVTDYETRLDYWFRSDEQPIYLGRNVNGAPTASPTWVIEKVEYDVSGRPVRKQTLIGAWDNRASLEW